jgi:hypothetical protein
MVAPVDARPAGGRISVDLTPNPATVVMEGDRAGFMTEKIRVLAIFDFPFEGLPKVAFTDGSGGGLKQHDLSPPEDELESSVWHLELANTCGSPTDISCVYYRPEDMEQEDDPRQIHFTVTAGGVSTLGTLRLQPEIVGGPAFTSPTTVTDPIKVKPVQGQCKGVNQCTNHNQVTVTATVQNLSVDGTVVVKYQARESGTAIVREVALVRSETNPDQWSYVFPVNTEKFRPGNPATFDFIAQDTVNGEPVSVSHEVLAVVVEQ